MNKKLFLVFVLVIAGVSLSAQIVSAQTQGNADASVTQTEITTKDLGIENPGLLPTSPFYFLKEWGMTIKRVFTFNPVKKAELELENTNQRAAEIKKLEEVAPQNIEAITKAIDKYKQNVDELRERLGNLKETSQNPNVGKLLDKLTERSLKHIQLFEDLKSKLEDKNELKNELDAVRDKLDDVVGDVPRRFEDPEAFKKRLQKVIEENQNGVLQNLRATEILDRISDKLPVEAKTKIIEVRDNLIRKIGEQINKLKSDDRAKIFNPETLKQLPGDASRRMEILDELKDKLRDVKTINKIEEFKNKVLKEQADEEGEIEDKIDSFEDCVDGGYPVLETFPEQCKTPDGQSFINKEEESKKDEEMTVCTEQYEPVCGSDNKTYSNSCYAEREGIKEYKKGECPVASKENQAQTYTVSVTNDGFSPRELTIKKGDKVTWVNKTDRAIWPASAVHPTHQIYPAFDALRGFTQSEISYSFVFDKVGSWKYHDHLNPSATGAVEVSE